MFRCYTTKSCHFFLRLMHLITTNKTVRKVLQKFRFVSCLYWKNISYSNQKINSIFQYILTAPHRVFCSSRLFVLHLNFHFLNYHALTGDHMFISMNGEKKSIFNKSKTSTMNHIMNYLLHKQLETFRRCLPVERYFYVVYFSIRNIFVRYSYTKIYKLCDAMFPINMYRRKSTAFFFSSSLV